jgi:hypothetical protein
MKVAYVMLVLVVTLGLLGRAAAFADPRRDAILAGLLAQAQQAEPGFAGFSAERGAALYQATHTGGKQGTGSCTACHGTSPQDTTLTKPMWRSGSRAIARMYWGGPAPPERRATFSPICWDSSPLHEGDGTCAQGS